MALFGTRRFLGYSQQSANVLGHVTLDHIPRSHLLKAFLILSPYVRAGLRDSITISRVFDHFYIVHAYIHLVILLN
jgi:hypothetical protein